MIKIQNILLEGLILYKVQVLIKSDTDVNQVYVYNEIRGLKNIVTVNVIQNDFLRSKSTENHVYSLLQMKYLATSDPREAIDNVKKDAMITSRINGLRQFIPRYNTIEKMGQY
jgi:hypothetical protein